MAKEHGMPPPPYTSYDENALKLIGVVPVQLLHDAAKARALQLAWVNHTVHGFGNCNSIKHYP